MSRTVPLGNLRGSMALGCERICSERNSTEVERDRERGGPDRRGRRGDENYSVGCAAKQSPTKHGSGGWAVSWWLAAVMLGGGTKWRQ